MSLRVLVTDTGTSLGRVIEQELEKEHCQLLTANLDWADVAQTNPLFSGQKLDLVINTCGWEAFPSDQDLHRLTSSVQTLAQLCSRYSVPLIQFSSYQVFGPDTKASHSEKDTPNPANAIGLAFLAVEQSIEQSQAKAILLRLGWVIDAQGKNLLTQILQGLESETTITLNTRLRGAPTLSSDVARVVIAFMKQISAGAENWGVMHYCSGDMLNQAEFGDLLIQLMAQNQLLHKDARIERVSAVPEDSPASAVLGSRRVRDCFGIQARPWRPNLLQLVKQWVHLRGLSTKDFA